MFTTDTGVSTLLLKEVPYKSIAYIKVQSVQTDGLKEHLAECVSFCRMCGAEMILAQGHAELNQYPEHCTVIPMALCCELPEKLDACVFPVTEATVSHWREIYNEKMKSVDNAATLTAWDEKKILQSRGACYVHDQGVLLGIGWMEGSVLKVIASVQRGAGERVLRALLTAADSDRVTLEVASTNTRALALYKKLGFVQYEQGRMWYRIF